METIIIENIVEIVASLLMVLIGVLGAWLTAKLGKKTELQTINEAQQQVISIAQQTVDELQQTVVDGLKASREDGKLTQDEIKALGDTLVKKVMEKMSKPTGELLNAAGVDIVSLIQGAGEEWINHIKAFSE